MNSLPDPGSTRTHAHGVVLLGSWRATRNAPESRCHGVLVRQADIDSVSLTVMMIEAEWLLAAQDFDDGQIQGALAAAKAIREDVRLAILGERHDWRRCERWMRRGCRAYLEESISLRRAARAIHTAHTLEVNVVDRAFHQTLQERAAGTMPHLTRREREVLDLVRRGLRNRDIARTLHVTENTVEYHMRHLLAKFRARSRMEVIERATALGLA
ncbi:helix-turn-helix transcriptional regulator [Pilimelia terevasa]|uniref:helix-turn-helix transcriptional regulator n=1 Tax=Pilimelia terevasa TaxID=53372 RepID=UPI00166463D8|nr:response regulator transcription factor [Pilimelia terevasa]